ncbi:MAG: ATPase, T2SS/T4P/T4SS family [Patescibacteria group bacterium]|nr:Flp pilus assembly complex ATPase component TadA [Patescibacteria group bacterium]
MKKGEDQLTQFLVDSGLLTEKDIAQAKKNAQEGDWEDYLVKMNKISDEQLRKAYAYIHGIPYVNLENVFVPKEILRIVPETIARKYNIVAFAREKGKLKLAMLNPVDLPAIDFIRKKTELRIIPCLASRESIQKVLNQYQKSLQMEFGEIIERNSRTALIKNGKGDNGDGEAESLKKAATDLPVVKIVSTLVRHAVAQMASDIHVEPGEQGVLVRYRVDGILHDVMTLPKEILPFVVARIKVLSNLKLDEHRLPQDGRFKINEDNLNVSFRVSVIPVYGGEKVVMRILDESSKGLTLEQVGLEGSNLEMVQAAIRKPNGMILVSGPTGSGKTTTLYTVIDLLNSREVNISTIEDPIEYRIQGINQTQVNPKIGLNFAIGLRSLLRQDPDIILVGEIRDKETAEIAAHSAMTGHLVLSTIHTNSAAGAMPRLIDMGIESYLVASTLNLIIAQRLVRKVCPNCVKTFNLDTKQIESLKKAINVDRCLEFLKKDARMPEEIRGINSIEEIKFSKGAGCDRCGTSGLKGRVGVFEVLEVDEEIAKMITQEKSSNDIEAAARQKGMRTMLEDGFLKAVLGITTIEEVLRVTKE